MATGSVPLKTSCRETSVSSFSVSQRNRPPTPAFLTDRHSRRTSFTWIFFPACGAPLGLAAMTSTFILSPFSRNEVRGFRPM
jgi:hypothetical protein